MSDRGLNLTGPTFVSFVNHTLYPLPSRFVDEFLNPVAGTQTCSQFRVSFDFMLKIHDKPTFLASQFGLHVRTMNASDILCERDPK